MCKLGAITAKLTPKIKDASWKQTRNLHANSLAVGKDGVTLFLRLGVALREKLSKTLHCATSFCNGYSTICNDCNDFFSVLCGVTPSSVTRLTAVITPPSGQGLVIPIFFIFIFSFFGWSLAQDLQVRARILGGRNTFCTLGEGQQRRGLMTLGLFLLCSSLSLKKKVTTACSPLCNLSPSFPLGSLFPRFSWQTFRGQVAQKVFYCSSPQFMQMERSR